MLLVGLNLTWWVAKSKATTAVPVMAESEARMSMMIRQMNIPSVGTLGTITSSSSSSSNNNLSCKQTNQCSVGI